MNSYEATLALWQGYNITTVADLDLRLDSFRILFAYNSGRLENQQITYHDTREIFENGRVTNYTGDTRAIFEQGNQKLCYGYLKDKIVAKEPLSIGLIKEVHRILTSGTYDERRYLDNGERPGEFKKHDYVIGLNEAGSPPEDVEADMLEMLDVLQENAAGDILKLATYLHARFEYIHPFADGNGRVGRTLMNYFLMINGHPPIIIYDEDKRAYYSALEQYDTDEDYLPLYAFLQAECVKTWSKALDRRPIS